MARIAKAKYGNGPNGATLGFEATMWAAADPQPSDIDVFKAPIENV